AEHTAAEFVPPGSCQVTSARLVPAWTMTAALVDSSRQRHQASENSGKTRAAATAGIIAVKTRTPPPCQAGMGGSCLGPWGFLLLCVGFCRLVAGRSPPAGRLRGGCWRAELISLRRQTVTAFRRWQLGGRTPRSKVQAVRHPGVLGRGSPLTLGPAPLEAVRRAGGSPPAPTRPRW